MGQRVLILGESGTGKSYSLRNFKPEELAIINVAGKVLPFRGGNKFEKLNNTYTVRNIKSFMKDTNKKVIVIDDAQYIMSYEFMNRATEKGWDKYTEIAQHIWEIAQAVNELPDDVIVYFLMHLDRNQDGFEKVKTIGKMLDEKITFEGMFTVVLKTVVKDGVYTFQTQNNGNDTVKSPADMFGAYLIDNDLKAVDTCIRDYYELPQIGEHVDVKPVVATKDEATAKRKRVVKEEPKAETEEEPTIKKTFAEKVADYVNKEPGAVEPKAEEAPTRRRRASSTQSEEVKAEVVEEAPKAEVVEEPATPTRRRRVAEVVAEEVKAEEPKVEVVEEIPVRRRRRG